MGSTGVAAAVAAVGGGAHNGGVGEHGQQPAPGGGSVLARQPGERRPSPSTTPGLGFSEPQLHVLRAQIFAFRSLKKGSRDLPAEVMSSLKPPPLRQCDLPPGGMLSQGAPQMRPMTAGMAHQQYMRPGVRPVGRPPGPARPVYPPPTPEQIAAAAEQAKRNAVAQAKLSRLLVHPVRRFAGPIYVPTGTIGEGDPMPYMGHPQPVPPLIMDVDGAQLLAEECARKREKWVAARTAGLERLVEGLPSQDKVVLAGQGRDRISVQVELKSLRLMELQRKVREDIEAGQQDVMLLGERQYRKFVRACERTRQDSAKQADKKASAKVDSMMKRIGQGRKKVQERNWNARDMRINRNRGVLKFHDRMVREHMRAKDDDRQKRMDALKANDIEAYKELLQKEGQKAGGMGEVGGAGERYNVLSDFLSETESYLQKLGDKVAAVKVSQERTEAFAATEAEALAAGMTPEEAKAAAEAAAEEVDASHDASNRARTQGTDAQSRYYSLAHTVSEAVVRQPAALCPPDGGSLREYQLVGLQWMVSLYNNHLNGILADEMGLGKTVQVMALIAYLMEFKADFGPHLIIVPNAVIVNWKSELTQWLPSARVVYYVGGKEERSKLFAQHVSSVQFNVLVTTYEFIMRDRAKLCKIDWKYLIIDEAQRMKDRESKLSRDLDKFSCRRRLLLTGTPLQNELRELWSLLNLLLPEVFDSQKSFNTWFSDSLNKNPGDPAAPGVEVDDWLETEKRIIVIHRLHQILEPFMLRRQVEDVERRLPKKTSNVLKCPMSAYQGAIYDWVKATGTIRLDPEGTRLTGTGKAPKRAYAPLNNKCMELRKVCNHPYLCYPPPMYENPAYIVRRCGKLASLDRILVKLKRTGHRVLLFSTMTRLLDLLEHYLRWRVVDGKPLVYTRIDGSTSLEDREKAIQTFNKAQGEAQPFIFLLSIRAAGRGLNLQTADTVVIYDPDPNPKNEEQAIARSHRIGQKREVNVIYLEAVADAPGAAGPGAGGGAAGRGAELGVGAGAGAGAGAGGGGGAGADAGGDRRYADSIESLVRNNIQQHKIEMADEVINAGKFDQRTTQTERRVALEEMLKESSSTAEAIHKVPTHAEINRMIARSDEEVAIFDRMDQEEGLWPDPPVTREEVPEWLLYDDKQLNHAVMATAKVRPGRAGEAAEAAAQMAMDAADAHARGESVPIMGRGMRSARTPSTKDLAEAEAPGEEAGGGGAGAPPLPPPAAPAARPPQQQPRVDSGALTGGTGGTGRASSMDVDGEEYEEVGPRVDLDDTEEEDEGEPGCDIGNIIEDEEEEDDVAAPGPGGGAGAQGAPGMHGYPRLPLKKMTVKFGGAAAAPGGGGGGAGGSWWGAAEAEQSAKRQKMDGEG